MQKIIDGKGEENMNQEIIVTQVDSNLTTLSNMITKELKSMNSIKFPMGGSLAGNQNFLLVIPIAGTVRYEISLQTTNLHLQNEVAQFRNMKNMYVSNTYELARRLQRWSRM